MKTSASEPEALTPARGPIATIIARYATEDGFALDQAVSDMLELFSHHAATMDSQRTAIGWIAACALSELRAGRVTTVWPEHDHLAEPVGLCIAPSVPHREPEA